MKLYRNLDGNNFLKFTIQGKLKQKVLFCLNKFCCQLFPVPYLHLLLLCWYGFSCWQGPEVRSGDLPQPIMLASGQEFTFTIQRGVGTTDTVSVNYDDFVNDVEVGDMLLVDGMLLLGSSSFFCYDPVKCQR